ncbi:hypothetical protein Scep_024096 [Stephania cephalantha]|uniref:Secreted protein n=1 Tax=Stephania cephalantha TaxID=152367 RepID=A0AAP0HXY3_9MAGN
MKFLLSVLAGDFLLSRACVALASLRNTEGVLARFTRCINEHLHLQVVSLLAKVVEHLVTGETMQMTSTSEQRCSGLAYHSLTTLDFTGDNFPRKAFLVGYTPCNVALLY